MLIAIPQRPARLLLAVLLTISVTISLAAPSMLGTAFANHADNATILGGFEIDGDTPVNNGGTYDWANAPNLTVRDDGTGSGDTIFDPGKPSAKEGDWPDWSFGTGNVPPKDDFLTIYESFEVDADSAWLWVGFTRMSGVGNADVRFEFNQSGSMLDRTVGDIMLSYFYDGNIHEVTITPYFWSGTGWVACTTCAVAGTVDASRTFGEAGVDLLALIAAGGGSTGCVDFATFSVRSRSSSSPDDPGAQLKDVGGPFPIDLSTCAELTIVKKDAVSGDLLDGAVFEVFEDNAPVGTFGAEDVSVGTCTTGDAATGTCVFDELDPGSYVVKEITAPPGYLLDPNNLRFVTLGFREFETVTFNNPRIPYRVRVSPDSLNEVGAAHTFTVTVEYDPQGDGTFEDAPDGTTPDLDWNGPAGSSIASEDCTTTGTIDGDCSVTVTSPSAGGGTLTATYGPYANDANTTFSDEGVKEWVDYLVEVEPDATNEVGTPHTFTVTVSRKTLESAGFTPLAGVVPDIDWSGPPGSTIESENCSAGTNAAGQCTVTVLSPVVGSGDLTATYETTVDSGTITRDDTATKTWVDYTIRVAPAATNEVGTDHTFTVTIRRVTRTGSTPLAGATPTLDWTGPAGSSIVSENCTTTGTDADGQCEVTVHSDTTGTGTLEATFRTVLDSGAFTISDDAPKTWVDYRINVTPRNSTNEVGSEHVFTVKIEEDRGAGWQPLANAVPAIVWAGPPGSAIIAETCSLGTTAAGTCTVTVDSPNTGEGELTATFSTTLDSGPLTRVSLAGKDYVDYRISVTPVESTNRVGSEHVFTVKIEEDLGQGFAPLAGAIPEISWGGPPTSAIVAETCSAGTDAAGQCTVTVDSPDTGTGTLTATFRTTLDSGPLVRRDEGGKTWGDVRVRVSDEATNLVGQEHTFTVWVEEISNTTNAWVGVKGAKPGLLWEGLDGSSIIRETCSAGTLADGTCTVTVNSPNTGTGTLTAEYIDAFDSGVATVRSNSSKTYIDYRVTVNPPTAVNPVGTTHTFIATLEVETEEGEGFGPADGEELALTLDGPGTIIRVVTGTIADDGRTATCETDDNGECAITITSNEPGQSTLTAAYTAITDSGIPRVYDDQGGKTWREGPAIQVVKDASEEVINCDSEGICPTVTYTYVVTNIGDVTLTDITLDDDKLGPLTLAVTTLEPGESTTATADFTPGLDLIGTIVVNVATTTGTSPSGERVTDDDPAQVEIRQVLAGIPGIRIEKTADPVKVECDANGVCPPVTYTYVITNGGQSTLTNVTLVDDKLGPLELADTTLDPGESTIAVAVYTPVVADIGTIIVNVGTTEGEDPEGNKVTDSDPASVEVTQVLGECVGECLPRTGSASNLLLLEALAALLTGSLFLLWSEWRLLSEERRLTVVAG